jgi:signal transduction histidine kinase
MTPEQIKNAFDFGITQKEGRVRLRLGLATSRRTVEEIGGKLEIESTPGEGTRVYTSLLLAQ